MNPSTEPDSARLDGTDFPDIQPVMPPFLEGPLEVVGAIATGIVLTVATVAALLILIRTDKGGPVLSYGAAVLVSAMLSAIRENWWIAGYAVLILPAFYGIRWLFRLISDRWLS